MEGLILENVLKHIVKQMFKLPDMRNSIIIFSALIMILSACDKEVCRDCYLIRSMLCTYTDTALPAYIIPGDTVLFKQDCDKEKDFSDDKFKEEKYEYNSPSMFYPNYTVHVVVTDIYKCPEKTN